MVIDSYKTTDKPLLDIAKEKLDKKGLSIKGHAVLYYPFLFSEWEITYTSFFRKRRAKKLVAFNSVRGGGGFSDNFPSSIGINAGKDETIPEKYSVDSNINESREMVRRYFIHHVRSWSHPEILMKRAKAVYMPYLVLEASRKKRICTQILLFEAASNSLGKLSNFPEIEVFYENMKRAESSL